MNIRPWPSYDLDLKWPWPPNVKKLEHWIKMWQKIYLIFQTVKLFKPVQIFVVKQLPWQQVLQSLQEGFVERECWWVCWALSLVPCISHPCSDAGHTSVVLTRLIVSLKMEQVVVILCIKYVWANSSVINCSDNKKYIILKCSSDFLLYTKKETSHVLFHFYLPRNIYEQKYKLRTEGIRITSYFSTSSMSLVKYRCFLCRHSMH